MTTQSDTPESGDTPVTRRRPRRATRPALPPEETTAEQGAPAQAEAATDADSTQAGARASSTEPVADQPAEPEKPAKATRSRSTRTSKAGKATDSKTTKTPDEPAAAEPAAAEGADEAPAAPKRTRSASTRARQAKQPRAEQPQRASDEQPAATDDQAVPAESSEATDQPAKSSRGKRSSSRSKRSGADAPESSTTQTPAPADETETAPAIDVLAEFGQAADDTDDTDEPSEEATSARLDDLVIPERDHDDASSGQGDESPRLPATALLFQAPDLTPRRKAASKRRAAEAAEAAEDQSEQQAPDLVEDTQADADQHTDDSSAADDSDGSDHDENKPRRRRRRGGRGRRRSGGGSNGDDSTNGDDAAESESSEEKGPEPRDTGSRSKKAPKDSGDSNDSSDSDSSSDPNDDSNDSEGSSSRRRRRRRSRSGRGGDDGAQAARDSVTPLKGSTRLEAKRQRRKEGRDSHRRRAIITEAEFLARRESVERKMIVREQGGRTQVAVLEDDVLVEHYVARKSHTSMVGNVYLGRVQNVLPSMEAAFVDLGRGRNAVLYAGEVNWDAAGLNGQPRKIENALSSGDTVLVQVTKDPIAHKGARLTSQITLAGRFLVLVPGGGMTGISRKLPESERSRLKKLLGNIVPEGQGVIVRTAAEGASEEELRRDVERLAEQWAEIEKKSAKPSSVPALLKGEPELATRVVRDIFNDDFSALVISGSSAWKAISSYVNSVAPDLADRMSQWTKSNDVFTAHRIDEQLAKGMDRKVWLPSGGSLVIDRTEAMTVVDVNTGKFTGSGGTLEETVTKNNLEAAEEIVRQLRLRDIGGIIVIDFIDMVLESNRDLVLRRVVECLARDRTRHQVAEVTSLGLVQMTRKRVGQGLIEAFSTTCDCCNGRGFHVTSDPVDEPEEADSGKSSKSSSKSSSRSRKGSRSSQSAQPAAEPAEAAPSADDPQREQVKATLAAIAAAAASAHEGADGDEPAPEDAPATDTSPEGEQTGDGAATSSDIKAGSETAGD